MPNKSVSVKVAALGVSFCEPGGSNGSGGGWTQPTEDLIEPQE
jgi:hypothetical protein